MAMRRFKVARKEAVFFQYILESYEGMFSVTTEDPVPAIIRVTVPGAWSDEAKAIISDLAREIVIEEVTEDQGGSLTC